MKNKYYIFVQWAQTKHGWRESVHQAYTEVAKW